MTTLQISLSRVQHVSPQIKLPPGVFRASKLMPKVLARYGLSMEGGTDANPPIPASEANDYFEIMVAGLESALAS
jgi:hypothetical protein